MKYTLSLKKNKDFKYILKKGNFVRGKYINVYSVYNRNNNNYNFLGICVSKKNGNSVNRNKLKRWAREVYKNNEQKLKKNINLIILFKKETSVYNTNYNLIEIDLLNALKGLKLYE